MTQELKFDISAQQQYSQHQQLAQQHHQLSAISCNLSTSESDESSRQKQQSEQDNILNMHSVSISTANCNSDNLSSAVNTCVDEDAENGSQENVRYFVIKLV